MDYEKKYNEALERFKSFKEKYYTKDTNLGDVIFDKTSEMQKDFNGIFPELNESGDERMLKKLIEGFENYIRDIRYFNDIDVLDILNFLEKQKNKKYEIIQWTGDNLKEVVEFTGKSPMFEKWFKSWEEYEEYVHSHGNIFKLFNEDGSHYEMPVGAWIVKTPDGYNIPSRFRFIQKPTEWSEEDEMKRNGLIKGLEDRMGFGWSTDPFSREEYIAWLKSLRPQPEVEWSEEDENKLNHILEIVHIASGSEASVNEKEELESFLKSLRSLKPHWKPSEEQMEALSDAWLACDDKEKCELLSSLYDDLKKLM